MQWDVFCRVVDNFGDIGVCWRLAADLAAHGDSVRLWVDDAAALAWMAPDGAAGVSVVAWTNAVAAPVSGLGDVVIEAFGCELPAVIQRALAARARAGNAAVWINLEYLSAEPFTARAHGLPSPQLAGPAAGLTKWFFYPGFDDHTGGLLRERDLAARQAAFDAPAWLATRGIKRRDGERVVSLFCYASGPVAALIDALRADAAPTLLLATAGAASERVSEVLGPTPEAGPAPTGAARTGSFRAVRLPYLTQRDFDHLLWCADLNVVRGEDSLVRALWAGQPFLWHIYPQADDAHQRKLVAFDRLVIDAAREAGADERFGAAYAQASLRWNARHADTANPPLELPGLTAWRATCQRLRANLLAQSDLATRLQEFVRGHGPG